MHSIMLLVVSCGLTRLQVLLLQAGVDITVIALWLGHENPVTTYGYVEADLAMKESALACIGPPEAKRTRYRPDDALLKFLEEL